LVITIDFETYYDREFSLSKITTEEYVRDRRFEVIGVGVKVDGGETEWFSGTEAQTKFWLGKFKWERIAGACSQHDVRRSNHGMAVRHQPKRLAGHPVHGACG
jgi:hypothetical protein